MINVKTLIPYLFGLVSLVVSLGIVNQVEPMAAPLPSPTPTATPLPKAEPFPGAARWLRCQALSQPRSFFYRPTNRNNIEKGLIISGIVYASDLTPLPNARIKISQPAPNQMGISYPYSAYIHLRTDEKGYYEFNTAKFTGSGSSYLHYQVTYRNYCPLLIHLHLITELPAQPVKRPIFAKVVEITGPVLQGPFDIVLPVPPPVP